MHLHRGFQFGIMGIGHICEASADMGDHQNVLVLDGGEEVGHIVAIAVRACFVGDNRPRRAINRTAFGFVPDVVIAAQAGVA